MKFRIGRCAAGLAVAAGLLASMAQAAFVTVENPGNAGELSGAGAGGSGSDAIVGAVAHEYRISEYEVTAGEYTAFLNAVAAMDTHGLYNANMWTNSFGCKIQQSGSSGSYTYSVAADYADRPVNYVSWYDAARYTNWLHNGQPTGAQEPLTTENGAYDMSLPTITRSADATYFIPTEDEWHKAAYYDPALNGGNGGYYSYPTGSDSVPSNILDDPDPGNNATFSLGSGNYTIGSPYYRTEVGAHENSASPYGTFDQGGNVGEWNETLIGGNRGVRGGSFYYYGGNYLHAAYRFDYAPTVKYYSIGFRVASMPVPHTVNFDLGGHGTRTGGGELEQQVEHGAAAAAPTFSVDDGWTFAGWSTDFLAVSGDLTVTALYSRTSVVYMVIDVSAGPEATSYPVTYLSSLPDPIPDEYKTTKVVLRHIPAGTFIMGSPEDELGREIWDTGSETQREVTLTQDFYIGVFQLTQKQWELVMGDWPSYSTSPDYRDTRPVEQVSYNDIRGSLAGAAWPANDDVDSTSFFGQLHQKVGLPLDLPTEAQWEYACRAGTTTALNSGKNLVSPSNSTLSRIQFLP